MGKTWSHPKWGRFRYEANGWHRQLSAPGVLSGKVPLNFETPDSSCLPSSAAVKVAEKFWANLKPMLKKAIAALWDDLTGHGPRSGMWWHGKLDDVSLDLVDHGYPALTSVDELREMLTIHEITILESAKGCAGAVVAICVGVSFERGWSFNILANHRSILGICFEPRAFGFDSPRKKELRKRHKMPIWTHPELGRFKYEAGLWWYKSVHLPAFELFVSDEPGPSGYYSLYVIAEDKLHVPSPLAVELISKLFANQELLAQRLLQALWDDFSGTGEQSGTWWSGNLEAVADSLAYYDLPPIGEKDDLRWALGSFSFHIHSTGRYQQKPLLEFSFSPDFEPEHGLGVVSDGSRILGIGYSGDLSLFKGRKLRTTRCK